MKAWIQAARLRTLPLTLVCIGTGSAVAYLQHQFSGVVFALTVLTAVLLQVLSNFANDYGDFVKGTDNDDRVGPTRALQSGSISQAQMKTALWLCGGLAFLSGVVLLFYALHTMQEWFVFLLLGIFSILAAITYTVGKNAYGYHGMGDVMVFIFFGLVGVFGSYYLHASVLDLTVFLPAATVGFFSAGVLNMNNTRDIENDKACGKNTIPVRLGLSGAKTYQVLLILAGWVCTFLFLVNVGQFAAIQLIWLVPSAILFAVHLLAVVKEKEHKAFDKQLKICVLSTLIFGVSFAGLCYSLA